MAKKTPAVPHGHRNTPADRLEDARLLGHAYDGDLWCARCIRRRSSHRNHWDFHYEWSEWRLDFPHS